MQGHLCPPSVAKSHQRWCFCVKLARPLLPELLACMLMAAALHPLRCQQTSKALRRGKGKMRNRRYVLRKGPLVIYSEDSGVSKAFRNLPGVEVAAVERLNLLQLAPGGHLGRFCIWTQVRAPRGCLRGSLGFRGAQQCAGLLASPYKVEGGVSAAGKELGVERLAAVCPLSA